MSFMVNLVRREAKVATVLEVNQNARFAVEKMVSTIRNSKDATSPSDGTSGSSLTLTMPSAAVSPTVFQVTNGVLTMKQGAGAAVPLTSAGVKVASLTFTNLVDPVAHARTSPGWVPCNESEHSGSWYCIICKKSNQTDYCWDKYPGYLSGGWLRLLLDLLLGQAKLGSCLQSTAAKSVIRIVLTVSAPPTGTVMNDYSSSITLYGTATVPRQN